MKAYIILKILYLAAVYHVEPSLAVAVAKAESGLNPYAYHKVSHATGLFQVRPEYSAYTAQELMDIETNIRQGLLRIKHAKRQCGVSYEGIEFLRCYNQGAAGAKKDKSAGDRYMERIRRYL